MENHNPSSSEFEELPLEILFGDNLADESSSLHEPGTQPLEERDMESGGSIVHQVNAKKANKKTLTWQSVLLSYLHDLVFLLSAVVLIFLLCFRVVVVSGTSMNNTLLDGDYLLLIGNVFYRNPSQGDIIVASKDSFDNGAPIVKRVIATEGQKVDIDFRAGVVYVDDVALEEPYTLTPTTLYEGVNFPLVVEEGCVFVMGDNRNDSKDSRNPQIGLIDCREVLGKVVFLFLPGTNYGQYERAFDRIGVVS